MELSKATLASLLKEAQKAHHIYEQELGHADENWHEWYASFVGERLL